MDAFFVDTDRETFMIAPFGGVSRPNTDWGIGRVFCLHGGWRRDSPMRDTTRCGSGVSNP